MKLKQRPTDFRVDEILDTNYLQKRGGHRVYRVTKRRHTSIEAARALSELAGVATGEVKMAGLKDRQGVTQQYMSVKKGRPVQLNDPELGIESVGFAEHSLSSTDSVGNAFQIVVRDLGDRELNRLRASLHAVRDHGLPNYFDEQRFGNLRHGQGWIARDLSMGRMELGLKRLLTAISDFESNSNRNFKSAIYRNWGNWKTCRDIAGRFGQHHSVFEHLRRNEDDFAGAFRYIASKIRLIHLYAWQSHLWNRALALQVDKSVQPGRRFTLRTKEGKQIFPMEALPLDPAWQGCLPLPGAQLDGVELDDQRALFETVLREEGLQSQKLQIQGVPGFALKSEPREALVFPQELRVRPAEPDPANRGKKLVRISFQLPRGSYATLVVRRLVGPPRAS